MINHDAICRLIPHAGSMCLLDSVVSWDENSITCLSETHLHADNPLQNENKISSVMLIEYGAQAMAVHGGLKAKEQGDVMAGGYLAALRNINLADTDVREIKGTLRITAQQLMAQGGSMIYEFSVCEDANDNPLASGRATVIELQNEA